MLTSIENKGEVALTLDNDLMNTIEDNKSDFPDKVEAIDIAD